MPSTKKKCCCPGFCMPGQALASIVCGHTFSMSFVIGGCGDCPGYSGGVSIDVPAECASTEFIEDQDADPDPPPGCTQQEGVIHWTRLGGAACGVLYANANNFDSLGCNGDNNPPFSREVEAYIEVRDNDGVILMRAYDTAAGNYLSSWGTSVGISGEGVSMVITSG